MSVRTRQPSASYSVGATCKRVGIGAHTLRAWESRYSAVTPQRSDTGRRTYSESEIERLEALVKLTNLGHAIGSVANLPNRDLQQLLRKSAGGAEPVKDFDENLLVELRPALERFDIHLVSSLLDQRRAALGTRLFILQILLPLLQWIGSSIERGRLSIAHEHALSAVLKDQIYQSLRYGTKATVDARAPRFVLATAEDDLHEFGVLMASALVAHHGLSSHFLGANLPVDALALAVRAVEGSIVVLGNSPVPADERKVSFDEYLMRAHALLPKAVEVWIGGAGKVPQLRRVMSGRSCRVLHSLTELDAQLAKAGG